MSVELPAGGLGYADERLAPVFPWTIAAQAQVIGDLLSSSPA
ncbi:MAG: hypothetical protein M0Z44_08170 [Gammaproteobacteria bacterium]|nr:hypothetical protein [Gammaproteobacteria bacterium]